MVKAAEKAGNIVQLGFQRRQSEAFKKTKELLDSGRIGNLHQVIAQINYNPDLKGQYNSASSCFSGLGGMVWSGSKAGLPSQVLAIWHGDLKRSMVTVIWLTGEFTILT